MVDAITAAALDAEIDRLQAVAEAHDPQHTKVAQALFDRFIERGEMRGRSSFRHGARVQDLPPSYRDDFYADARAAVAAMAPWTEGQVQELASAAWQVLDDMDVDGTACCESAKAWLRWAYEPFRVVSDETGEVSEVDYSLEAALEVLYDVGHLRRPPAEVEDSHG